MQTLRIVNYIITLVFTVCYAYQFVYIPISWFVKRKQTKVIEKPHTFAALICARNEAEVIGDLISSIKNQSYPTELIHIFVMADNCDDNTAEIAEKAGAVVYTRFNKELVGKGYALEALMKSIKADYPDGFDGYFVFDADNILSKDYVKNMNKTFSEGHDIVTSYRNSKNYGSNWISAGYALWFLRESRYLNQSRFVLKHSCAVSGTGFLFSRKVAQEIGDWPFHMLTEDIEFSVNQIVHGRKIAYCKEAELYDEQPVSFKQSWNQRMRWSRGYLQVYFGYGLDLLKGLFHGSFSCFDMAMTIMPAFFLTTVSLISNTVLGIWGLCIGDSIFTALGSIAEMFGNMYLMLFIVGMITTITEWKHIHTKTYKKILFAFTFPLFMFTYIPIAVASLFCKTSWKPIKHTMSAKRLKQDGLDKIGEIQL